MSAKELLEQVSKQLEQLPIEEREAFLDGVVNLEQTLPPKKESLSDRTLQWPDIHARHRNIFGDVLAENIVLAAREEEVF